MRYEIQVALNDEDRSREDMLTDVVECAGDTYDSADIDNGGVVSLEGRVNYPVRLAYILAAIRGLNWGKVKITGGLQ